MVAKVSPGNVPVLWVTPQVSRVFETLFGRGHPIEGDLGVFMSIVEISGTMCTVVWGDHPSPRAWSGGGYSRYVWTTQIVRAACEDPSNPSARVKSILAKSRQDVDENLQMLEAEGFTVSQIREAVVKRRSLLYR